MNVYVVVLIQMLVASGTHIIAKAVVRDVDAVTLTFVRSVIACSGLVILMLARGVSVRIDREHWGRIFLLGIYAIVNQFLYLYGIRFTTAANAALLYASTPVFVLLLSFIVLNERITLKKMVGIILAFAGVSIVIFERGINFTSEYTFGNLVILIAVVTWALFTIFGRSMVIRYGALRTTSVATFLGSIAFFPFGLYGAARFRFETLHSHDWLGILYLGIGTSILGYMLWYYALKRIEASKLAVFANGQPIVATVLSLVFLDYTITGAFVVGGIITIVGVVLTQLS